MTKLRFLLAGLTIALLGACAAGPGAAIRDQFGFPDDGKLGVIVLTDEHPKHAHWGITVFETRERELPQRWDVEGVTLDHLRTRLDRVEKIDPTPAISAADSTIARSVLDGSLSLQKELRPELERLAVMHGLDAILVVEPQSFRHSPRVTEAAEGYGVTSHCAGSCAVRTLHHVLVRVFSVDPAAFVGRGAHTKHMYKVWVTKKDLDPNINIETYSVRAFRELEKIPDDVVEVARDRFYEYLREEIDSALVSAGILPGA